MLELSKCQIFVNKCFKTTLNMAIQLVNHSIWQIFFEAKKLSHVKSVNEITERRLLSEPKTERTKYMYSTVIKKSSPYALSVVIKQ